MIGALLRVSVRPALALAILCCGAGSAAADPAEVAKLFQRYEAETDPVARKLLVDQLGKQRAAPELGKVLGVDPDEAVRLAAVAGLLEIDNSASTRHLVGGVGAFDPWVTEAIVEGLCARFRKDAVRRLHARLGDSEPAVRAAAARVVAHHDRAASAPALRTLLSDPSWRVREVVAPLLARLEPKQAWATLKPLVRDPSARVRLAVFTALGLVKGTKADKAASKVLVRAAKTESPWQVRRAAIESLTQRGPTPHRRVLFTLAKSKKHDWRVRAAAARALGRIRTKPAVKDLIELMKRTRGRLQVEVRAALHRLTGQPIRTHKDWEAFWAKAGETFTFPEAAAATAEAPKTRLKTRARFYGLPIESLRPCFVIDCSGSMAEIAQDPRRGSRARKSAKAPWTKWQVAKRELLAALKALPRQAKFGLFLFQDRTVPIQEQPVAAKPSTIKRILLQLERIAPTGATNMHGALSTVLHGAKPHDPLASKEVAFDTIYLLSDGLPTVGRVIAPDGIRKRVRAYNRFAEVIIHTVGIGQQNRGFLESLANDHNGRYVLRR